jgi:4-amino-4-deoxy-L-arabinose transferase-like glycosyltransferase
MCFFSLLYLIFLFLDGRRRRWQVMDKERSLLLLCLFYFIISWSLVAAGGKGKKKDGRVVHAAGGLSEWEEEPPV